MLVNLVLGTKYCVVNGEQFLVNHNHALLQSSAQVPHRLSPTQVLHISLIPLEYL